MNLPDSAEFIRDFFITGIGGDYDFYEVQAVAPDGDEDVTVALNVSEGIPQGNTYGAKVQHLQTIRVDLFSRSHTHLRSATREVMRRLESLTGQSPADQRFTISQVAVLSQSYVREEKQNFETSTINANMTVYTVRS